MAKSSNTESLYHIGICEDKEGQEEIVIIPTNWIFAKGECQWPMKPPNRNTSKLISQRADVKKNPDFEWIRCKYRPLYEEIYSYQDALRYEKKALDTRTSDLSTPENGTRKRHAPNRFVSSSDDDDSSPYPIVPSPLKGSKLQGAVKVNLFPADDAPLTPLKTLRKSNPTKLAKHTTKTNSAEKETLQVDTSNETNSIDQSKETSGINQSKETLCANQSRNSARIHQFKKSPGIDQSQKMSCVDQSPKSLRTHQSQKSLRIHPSKETPHAKLSKESPCTDEPQSISCIDRSQMSPRIHQSKDDALFTPLKPSRKSIKLAKHPSKSNSALKETLQVDRSNENSIDQLKETSCINRSKSSAHITHHRIHQSKETPQVKQAKKTDKSQETLWVDQSEETSWIDQHKESSPPKSPVQETDENSSRDNERNKPKANDETLDNSLQLFKEQFFDLSLNEQLFYIANGVRGLNRNMKVVKKTIASHSSILEKLCKKADPSTEPLMDLVKGLNFTFPMLHEQEFKDLDKKLCMEIGGEVNEDYDEEFRDKLSNVLRMHEGNSLVDSVNKICGFLLGDELARHYSYEGHKGKRKFKNYAISDIIIDTLYASHSEKESRQSCKKKMAWWLGHASERLRVKDVKRQKDEAAD